MPALVAFSPNSLCRTLIEMLTFLERAELSYDDFSQSPLSPAQEPSSDALQKMVEISSIRSRNESGALREMEIAPVPFFGGLTEKHIEVLVSAYENGLLSVPARTKMDAVAKKVGLSRSTYGEHLRNAMQTLVENSYPVLKLYASSYTNPGSEE